jgi:acyl-CoA thioester hydrolase
LVTPTPFTHTSAVRFGDTDMMGHVNNATFATYLESARVAFFASATGDTVGQSGLILARSEIDFVAPIFFGRGDVVTTVWVERVGTKSFRLGHVMTQDGDVVARAAVVLVAYDYAVDASRPLSEEERTLLSAKVGDAPG